VGTGVPPSGAVEDQDPVESSARLAWYDADRGSWFQTYYDTPATLRPKYLLALVAHTAGVGLWTLGYDAGLPGYPALVGEIFSQPVVGSVTVDPAVGSSLDVRVSVTTYDGPAATDGVRVSNDGVHWSPWLDAATLDPAQNGPKEWQLAVGPDGDRTVWVQSRDIHGALSTQLTATVLVDRAPPQIEGFSLRPAPVPGWIAQYLATDEGGIATTEIRWRLGVGDWTGWRPAGSLAAGSVVAAPDQVVRAQLRVTDRAGQVTTATTQVAGGWSRP
jgi:hypothetical protein